MRLTLREEKKRDNTKGIQDVGKASTVELNRTIDTDSPTKNTARAEIKRRKDSATKKKQDTKEPTPDTTTDDEPTPETTDTVSAEARKSTEKERDTIIGEYKRRGNVIKAQIKDMKSKDPKGYFTKALAKIAELANTDPAKFVGVDMEAFEGDHVGKTFLKLMQEKLEKFAEESQKKKTDKVESVQAAFDVLIQQLGDDANFDLIARIMQQNGVTSPKDFENLSEKERDKLLDLIDVEITEKGKDPFEMLDDAENQAASSVTEAMQKIISGATTKPRVSTREKWLNIYRGDF
jgi:hypothetical protein|tara:strand:- start:567 stop:1442 length:876 start_codon:yes stop_codon:yes gene_type:complete